MSDSWQPHGLQPTRLLRPWDFPGKSTGVGCHSLLLRPHPPHFLTCTTDAQAFSFGCHVSALASLLLSSQKPEWLLKMWVRSHHSSAQALQEVYILLRKKNIHIPFHELWALPFGPLSLAFLTSSPLSALLSAPATPVLLLFFKLAWDILPSDIYMAPFLPSFMSLLTFYLLKALRSIAVGK